MKMARVETAIRLGLDFFKAYNSHDVPAMVKLMGMECLFESSSPAPDGTTCHGKDAISRYWNAFFNEYTDARIEIEDAVGLGKLCVIWWKRFNAVGDGDIDYVRGVDIIKVRDNLIGEQTSYRKG